jgi:putative peptidoglycan lipid II flippase
LTRLARATATMSLGTVLSRTTGLLRLVAIAAALGIAEPGSLADTYNFANTAPNIIYELILGGILTSVFVPVFVELLEKEGRERAWQVASAVINVSLAVLTGIAILGVLSAPLLAKFYASDVEGAAAQIKQQAAMTFLLRLFVPQIIFYGLTAITAGFLNAHKRFGAPMYTPVLNNLAVIAVFVSFRAAYGEVTLGNVSTSQLAIIGVGTTAGVALMGLSQIPFLRGLGRYRLTFSIRHPSFRKLARLSLWVIGYVVVNQIGYLVVQRLATQEPGAYSAYVSAFTFFMLPHGLFAVSVITALLPGMSQHAVNERWDLFREQLSLGVRVTLLLALPAAIGLYVLAEPIVGILLRNGAVTQASVELVAGVLRFFVLGLVPFSLFQLFLRAFYSMHDTKTPFQINCWAVAVNTTINVVTFLVLDFGVRGLAAGHALAYVFGATLQVRHLARRLGGVEGARTAAAGARIGAAAAAMGVVVWGLWEYLAASFEGLAKLGQVALLMVPVVMGAACYVAFAALMRVEELSLLGGILQRRRPAHR